MHSGVSRTPLWSAEHLVRAVDAAAVRGPMAATPLRRPLRWATKSAKPPWLLAATADQPQART